MSYYSQNDEERAILEFFGPHVGTFLDIGAYDGIRLSNTRRLLELGWTGVLVEPAPHNMAKLVTNCRPYWQQTTLVQAAVMAHPVGLRQLFIDETPHREWSTTVNRELLEIGSVMAPSPVKLFVPTISLIELSFLAEYDLISIDAEWEDLAILKSFPKTMLDHCRLLCIEPRSLAERAEMKSILTALDYRVIHETPENILAANNKPT